MARLDLACSVRPLSLCLVCNAALQPVGKAALLERRMRESVAAAQSGAELRPTAAT